jgi:hypothetical protein
MPLEDHVKNVSFMNKKPYGLTNNTAITQARKHAIVKKNYDGNVVGISSQPLSRCLLRESALEKNDELN